MVRDFGREIDDLRGQIEALKRGEGASPERKDGFGVMAQFYRPSEEDLRTLGEETRAEWEKAPEWGVALAQEAIDKQFDNGFAKFSGIYRSPVDEGHMWALQEDVEALLNLDETVVERVLSAIGNRTRFRILKTILTCPSSANEIVAKLEMNTSGKAYHHLNMLEKADLIHKDDAGRFHFRGHRVSGFYAALFAVKNTVSDRYTSGNLDEIPIRDE
jgi:DNA-binding transcriptional ArsR family regulator